MSAEAGFCGAISPFLEGVLCARLSKVVCATLRLAFSQARTVTVSCSLALGIHATVDGGLLSAEGAGWAWGREREKRGERRELVCLLPGADAHSRVYGRVAVYVDVICFRCDLFCMCGFQCVDSCLIVTHE